VNAQSAVWRYPSISFRGWSGCTQATLKVICDLKYDQDICWIESSLVFIWWNWMCLLNIMRDFECDRDACWTWLIFDVLNVNVWNVHVECDVWPWIWSRCLLNLINFHVLNANVIVECDRYPWMWSNLNSWILHHLAFHNRKRLSIEWSYYFIFSAAKCFFFFIYFDLSSQYPRADCNKIKH